MAKVNTADVGFEKLIWNAADPPEEEQNALDIVLKQCEQWADVEPEYVYDE